MVRQVSGGEKSKSEYLSSFSSDGNEIWSLSLNIETFLNKERTESSNQSLVTDFFRVV